MKDLTFIEDGYVNFLNGCINFKKNKLIHKTITSLLEAQSKPYKFNIEEPLYTYCRELMHNPFEEELFELSKLIEQNK